MAKSPPPHKSGITPEILIAGGCELLFLNTPPHAAVDAANRLAQTDRNAVHFKPLINAVLRRIAREGEAIVASQDAATLNTPDWLWPRWSFPPTVKRGTRDRCSARSNSAARFEFFG